MAEKNLEIDPIQLIIDEYKESSGDEPLDGDAVDNLLWILKCKINLNEGNITQEEYDELLERGDETLSPQWSKEDIRCQWNQMIQRRAENAVKEEDEERRKKIEATIPNPFTEHDIDEVAAIIERCHDASIGINWEVIEINIDDYLGI